MQISLEGRSALVTGSSKGLGLAMARTFAEAGADVAIVARRPDVLAQAKAAIEAAAPGRKVVTVTADVSRVEQVQLAWQQASKALGKVDILVNNAGTSATGAFETITDETWMSDFELKLFAAIRLARLALPGMKQRRWGRIINVLNSAAKAPPPGGAPTAVSRAAGMALTKVLAGECAPHNVLVNALCTGILVSEQWEKRHARVAGDKSFDEYIAEAGKQVPLGRMGDPQEFANLACFLASDAASYVTGCAINIDGGKSPVV
jgi:3-oxoacyl-[acyl-carrier protein] reductase